MAIVYNTNIVRNGLVLQLDAANSKSYPGSGTIWSDLSGNVNTGTIINSPTYSVSNSGTFNFDGVNDYVDCGNNNAVNFGTGNFTVSMWFKRAANATTNLRLLSKAGSSDISDAANAGFAFYGGNDSLAFTVNPTAARIAISAGTYSLNEWVNVVGLIERGVSIRTYKNGVQVGTGGFTATGSVSGTTSLRLASAPGASGSLFWPGSISNVTLYNRALTPAEIVQNFQALRGRYAL